MKTLRALSATIGLVALSSLTPTQAQVTWGASNSNGLGDVNGTVLPMGDLVEIGTFNLTDSQIRQLQFDLPALTSAFVRFDTALVGDDVGVPGYWNKQSVGATDALGLNHQKIYYWAFNAPTTAQATQQGIFTANNNTRWFFPADADIPNTTTVDLADVNDIIVGGYGNGSAIVNGNPFPLFNLAPVPEPAWSALAFALICAGCASALRHPRVRRKFEKQ